MTTAMPNIAAAVARQVKEKNALIGDLNLKISGLEFQIQTQTAVAKNIAKDNAERTRVLVTENELLASKLAEFKSAGLEVQPCCISGKFWDLAELEKDGWWDDHNDQWYGPDELDSRPDWEQDCDQEWHECAGHKADGALHTYTMSGGSSEWWNIKVVYTPTMKDDYIFFTEDKGGWIQQKGAKLWFRDDQILIEEAEDDHEHEYYDTCDWELRSSMEFHETM
tara:strand:- start:20215 stop:20883 length:669 start_codon:yes stop_codon:yes gene_type:complete